MTASTPSPWAAALPAAPHLLERPAALLRFSGPDALRVLHGQTSQALQDARPGDWRSTCCLSATARLRGLAEVLVDEDGAWLALTAGDGPALRVAFDRVLFPADQVELGALRSGRWLRSIAQEPAAVPGRWRPLEGGGGWWLGSDALLLDDAPPPEPLASLPPLTGAQAELWRIGRGEPAWPAEINDAFNPFELGLADRVSLSKGCYVGQETLAKLASGDGVKQRLRRWHAQTGETSVAPFEAGLTLLDGGGDRAGQITSCLHLADGRWVGLAMVRRMALDHTTLWAELTHTRLPLHLSRPSAFVDPPPPSGGGRRSGLA
ncbi:MAG: folate-binding protein [Cyanobacteriota bacterium]|nr:folate-binding protein [Cyanobacteriota bacterium]